MKIVFLSNFFNHHQSALSDALWKKTGGEYLFVETAAIPWERKELGCQAAQREYTVSLKDRKALILQRIQEADVVIAGSAPEWLVRKRIQTGKLLFRYSERPLRNGSELLKMFPRWLRWHWRNPRRSPIYLLCAGAYTAGDYGKLGLFRGRSYCWGYFPEMKLYDVRSLLSLKRRTEILWCGRFLELKHPEAALAAARQLKAAGYSFLLKLIGTGEMEQELHQMVKAFKLEDCVRFLGVKKPEDVRNAMEQAGIYLFTSDKREGWGAVLNEAMNSGCAVIASHAVGSVPFLVKNGENGLIYRCGDVEMLCRKLRHLLENPEEQCRLGAAAYETIRNTWNGEAAADRLITLAESLLAGEAEPGIFADGPCSRAEERKESWFV